MRRQITLFVPSPLAPRINALRRRFNPVQASLIAAHVTLCRDDEVQHWGRIQSHVQQLSGHSVELQFGSPMKEGNGVYLSAIEGVDAFHQLRQVVLEDTDCRIQTPHITLVHPRNGTCSDADFEVISRECGGLDLSIMFSQITFIQQPPGRPWEAIRSISGGNEKI